VSERRLVVHGDVAVPGDKSITHRALLFAGAAAGTSCIAGGLAGADCRSTARVLRQLGCEVSDLSAGGAFRVRSGGLDAWRRPAEPLDCGNSGTTARLMLGLLAGRPICVTLTGDESLRARPMRRVTEPLAAMGATFEEVGEPDRLPLRACGGRLREISYRSPKASAQVKSAVLLAGVSGRVEVRVTEPILSRDHTERMLRGLGMDVESHRSGDGDGWCARLRPTAGALPPLELQVPGDPSSAAFLLALALLADAGELRVRGVGTNPTRTGYLRVLARMRGFVEQHEPRELSGEPVADLLVRPTRLRGTEILPAEVPALVEEVPVLMALAARAEGETTVRGAQELRVKESDRIAALVANLRAVGVEAEEHHDGLTVRGTDRPLAGRVRTFGDHRIAMAFGVLGALPGSRIEIDDRDCADISFPGFWPLVDGLAGGAPRGAEDTR
jgi:3-phosphoshikimate 1-carboxyvinyltransferase